MMLINKTWTLTKSLTFTLAPPNQRGICFKCSLENPILAISKTLITPFTYEEKKFCWSCALDKLYKLEQSDYEIENKKAVIREIRETLNSQPVIDSENDDEQPLECYG